MNNWIRRTLTLFALTATMTVSLAAQAGPLPVPIEPEGGPHVWPPPVVLLSPSAGNTAVYGDQLVWKNSLTPDKYTIKFVVPDTGATVKFDVPLDSCTGGGSCVVRIGTTPLLDHVKDGSMVTWRVIAKYGSDKSKSAARALVADTVNAPQTLLPADGAVVLPVHNLTWEASDANFSYTLLVKDAETNAVVIRQTLSADECAAVCAVSPYADGELAPLTEYHWFVKVKGFNGDKAKSAKQNMTTPEFAVAL